MFGGHLCLASEIFPDRIEVHKILGRLFGGARGLQNRHRMISARAVQRVWRAMKEKLLSG